MLTIHHLIVRTSCYVSQLLCIILLMSGPILGLESPALAASVTSPKSCTVGVYLISLRDLAPINKSFGADFWVWSNCHSKDLKPLQTMEVINGKDFQAAYDSLEEKPDPSNPQQPDQKIYWAQRKISSTLRHDWQVENFPFDRHTLEIPLEETQADTKLFTYNPDAANSSYKQDMRVDGWKIKKFTMRESTAKYQSTFGDPGLKSGESHYSRLSIFLDIERDSILSFFKLITGVYAAFATILLAFFLDPGSEFGSRTGLLVGSLFAVLVSMQSIDSVIGESNVLTMVDAIHVTTLGYLLAAVIAAVYSRILHERDQTKTALNFDRKLCFSIFLISFIIFNTIMISNAALKG